MKIFPTLFLVLVLVTVACGRGEQPPDPAPAGSPEPSDHEAAESPGTLRVEKEMLRDLRLTTTPVEVRPSSGGVTVLGEAGVNEEAYAEVGSPIAARIVRLLASAGDEAASRQPLAELQSTELGSARAEYLSARARAELANQVLERKRDLAEQRIAPERELQEAEAAARSASAELEAAEAALESLGVAAGSDPPGGDASRFILRSPLAGTVIERDAALGQMADPSRPIFRVADLSRLWLTVHAFERDALRFREGTTARVTFPALPGRSFSGKVAFIGRRVEASSRTIPVRIEVSNGDGVLRPGMSATAWLPIGEEESSIIVVPTTSLQRMREGWHVFIPAGEGLFEMREVGRGRDLGGEVEILTGLRQGEIVVVEGAFLLKAEAEKSRGEGEHHDH